MIDPASPIAAKIRAALRANELGPADPYALSYAGIGESGPSYGVFQNDVYASSAARATLWNILMTTGTPSKPASVLVDALRVPCRVCPLGVADEATVLAALASAPGRALVDALDGVTLAMVLGYVGRALDSAAGAGKTLDDGAACAVALWVNMTGAPATLDRWLGGEAVTIDGVDLAPPAGPVVSQADIEGYLAHTQFFEQHARNLAHLQASIVTGLAA